MLDSAVFAQIKIPLIVAHIHAEILDLLSENIITLLALTSADDLADTRYEKVRSCNGLAVVIEAHIEALYLRRIVR